MIQTEEIKKRRQEKIHATAKLHQALQADLGTVLPCTPEKIGGNP